VNRTPAGGVIGFAALDNSTPPGGGDPTPGDPTPDGRWRGWAAILTADALAHLEDSVVVA